MVIILLIPIFKVSCLLHSHGDDYVRMDLMNKVPRYCFLNFLAVMQTDDLLTFYWCN